MAEDEIIVPFLKWAGGKRWLTANYPELFPQKVRTYFEPFLGSGAVYFYLRPKHAVLADLNPELIETYLALRNNWRLVHRNLLAHQKNHSQRYYYRIRDCSPRSQYSAAARFVYLNRTCWNGLYRVNLRGQFNVPIGTKSNVILSNDNFRAIANLLSNADLYSGDFSVTIDKTRRGDFLFVDPPYTVKHNLNGFVKYNETLFSWLDQERLKEALCAASKRGVKILMTNANHESIRRLYSKAFKLITLRRPSVIAGDASFRQTTTELIICNY